MSKILELEKELNSINSEILLLEDRKLSLKKEIERLKDEVENFEIKEAIKNKDIKRLMKTKNGELTQLQEAYWKDKLFPTGKIFSILGHFKQTGQISFKLTLIDYSNNKNQIEKLIPILSLIFDNLEEVKLHEKVKPFRVIPILDRNKGKKGSYSLIMKADGKCAIYKESKMEPEIIFGFDSLEKCLIYAAKKLYFY